MKPEKQQLIHDLIDGEHDSRDAILAAGSRAMRRRRQVRIVMQIMPVMVMALLAVFLFQQSGKGPSPAHPGVVNNATKAIRTVTDDELLAMFPDTPVGLVTAGGKKHLIFFRPEDREKYMAHL